MARSRRNWLGIAAIALSLTLTAPTVSAVGVPAAPTGVSLTCSASSKVLSWAAVDGAGESVQYQVQYYDAGVWRDRWLVSATSQQVDVADARWRVLAQTASGTSAASTEVREGPNTPPSWANLAFSGSSGSLTWGVGSDNCWTLSGYTLIWTDLTTQATGTIRTTGNSTTATLSPMTQGHSYRIRLETQSSRPIGTGYQYRDFTVVAATPPATPVLRGTGAGADYATLTWDAPQNNGAAITDYVIEYAGADGVWRTFNDGASSQTTAVVNGLATGTQYQFRVAAVNQAGTGATSNVVAGTPSTIPSTPSVTLSKLSSASIRADWTVGSSGGLPVTGYSVQLLKDGQPSGAAQQVAATQTQATFSNLTVGATYSVSVVAANANGNSTAGVSASQLAADLPTAPRVQITGHTQTSVTLQWAESTANGSAISDYRIQYAGTDGSWQTFDDGTSIGTSTTISGLTTGRAYRFRVAAVNALGAGPWSAEVSEASSAPPGAARAYVELGANASLQVKWTAAPDNGAAIQRYDVGLVQGNSVVAKTQVASDARSHTFTGLRLGSDYWVQIVATNRDGAGTVARTFTVSATYTAADWKSPLTARQAAQLKLDSLRTSVGQQSQSVGDVAKTLFETEASAKRVAAQAASLKAKIARICATKPKPKGC